MDIRQLRYLIALAQEEHFTRAAEICNVTQPTLSGRIRQLEQELGVSIVKRGQRYHGLTDEGQRVLRWAKRIVEDCESMRGELEALTGDLRGAITLGVIPSALPMTPDLTGPLRALYPQVGFSILSKTSNEIIRQLEDYSIDAGITYLDNEPLEGCRTWPLYRESYRLIVGADHPLVGRESVTWAEAAELPLCLLTPDMQNRRIVDAAFRKASCVAVPEIESNSIISLVAHVQSGALAAVLPENVLRTAGGEGRLHAIPIADPAVEYTVGLAVLDRDPLPILAASLVAIAESFGG
ncbi:LysR family transcriptional regulator [Nisaea acidiphila]|uniref:LysR family transcriptional regulator n=1 Tax=Nisaea acidiphila TaxID=1862145 RepID=A0A9J7AQV0_9PROT|nr:LysR family transcriptional regulator [Nisaea acidiphila]UUX48969.1 LysR family transcriptional regulator [Nisaea acidiphila]